jgi:membrane associated rhomboid family serine protease
MNPLGTEARRSSPVASTILVANLVVFGLWLSGALPLPVMIENFLVSWRHLEDGRFWTLLTSVFSHNWLFHLLVNMIVLRSFGPPLERLLGSAGFLGFYLVAGLSGSLAHALVSNYLMDSPEQAALGASSALAGVLLVFSLTFPKARVLLFFVIPLPAIAAALLFIGIDIWGLTMQIRNGGWPIGHGAHLGGALVGAVYFAWRGGTLRERRRALEAAAAAAYTAPADPGEAPGEGEPHDEQGRGEVR